MRSHVFFIVCLLSACSAQAQKRFSEGTVTYSISITTPTDTVASTMTAIQKLKGGHVRMDIISTTGRTTSLYDNREGAGAFISEMGAQRLMVPLTEADWRDRNSWYIHSGINWLEETKDILGYACQKAEVTLKNGTNAVVFYAKGLVIENNDTDLQFGDIPGMVLEYTLSNKASTVRYQATALNFDPVPIQQFDIPTAGYRVLDYKSSKELKKN